MDEPRRHSHGFHLKEIRHQKHGAIYPGRRHNELPIEARTRLDNYKIAIFTIEQADDKLIGLTFRRWQQGMPLTLAEKLYSYDGITKDIASRSLNINFGRNFLKVIQDASNHFNLS